MADKMMWEARDLINQGFEAQESFYATTTPPIVLFQKALTILEAVEKSDEMSFRDDEGDVLKWDARFQIGLILLREGSHKDALERFNELINLNIQVNDGKMATVYYNAAMCYRGLGKIDELIEALQQAARYGDQDAQDALARSGESW